LCPDTHQIDEIDQTNQIDQLAAPNAPNDNNEMHPEQIRIYQAMEPERKLKLAQMLYYSAKELKAASLKARYPDWTEEKIKDKVREIFLYART
jgi:hypothetical protein